MNIGQFPGLGATLDPGLLDQLDPPEYEFMAATLDYTDTSSAGILARDEQMTEWLNEGWQIDDHLVCPPLVTLFMSREKEGEEA